MTFRDYPVTLRYALEPVQMGSCYLFVIFSTSSQSQSSPYKLDRQASPFRQIAAFTAFTDHLPITHWANLVEMEGIEPSS